MNPDINTPQQNDEETLSAEWIAALRSLPSEHMKASVTTDAAILAYARKSFAVNRSRRVIRMIWPTLAAAACLALGFTLLAQRDSNSSNSRSAATAEDPYAVILREVTSLFPHQVRAIKTEGGDLQIVLSAEPVADGTQAVVIEACGNGSCTVVITYVGQTITMERQQVTVRAEEGGIIIIENQQDPAFDLQIKSRNI